MPPGPLRRWGLPAGTCSPMRPPAAAPGDLLLLCACTLPGPALVSRRPAGIARRPLRLRLPDLEPGETSHGHAVVREHLLDRLLLLLDERLLDQHHVLVEGVDPAVDDLGDRLLGLALLAGDLLRDPALLLHYVGRDLVPGGVLRAHGRDLLSQVL